MGPTVRQTRLFCHDFGPSRQMGAANGRNCSWIIAATPIYCCKEQRRLQSRLQFTPIFLLGWDLAEILNKDAVNECKRYADKSGVRIYHSIMNEKMLI